MTGFEQKWPPLGLGYLSLLTDDTGLIQHALYSVPNRPTGYTTDDNARALIVAVREFERTRSPEARRLASIYLAYLYHALTPDNYFHNLMSYDRRWIDARGSEDSHGRALWAAGTVSASPALCEMARAARQVFEDAVNWARSLRSLRAMAFALLGLKEYLTVHPDAAAAGLVERLANSLAGGYERHRAPDWEWFENSLNYSNGMLPNALLAAYTLTGNERYRDAGQATLEFLTRVTVVDDVLAPIGCHGWYVRGGTRAQFDQQPVDVAAMVLAYVSAWRTLKDERYRRLALLAFEWFLGRNALGLPMVNPETGGCHDGLMPDRVNGNQGAESQVAYLMAYQAVVEAGLA